MLYFQGFICFIFIFIAFSNAPAQTVSNLNTYHNPVIHSLADPCILYYNGRYYLSGTGDNVSYDIYISDDLIHWDRGNKIFGPRDEANVWAPDLFFNRPDGKFYLYYTVNYKIGVASSDTPDGNYSNLGYIISNALDAHMFRDDDGSYYLYYANNADLKIYVQPMISAVGKNGAPVMLTGPDRSWENPRNEAPWIIKSGNTYYLIYSGNDADSSRYAIGYATSVNPAGPFVKYAGNPIMKRSENIYGPGSCCTVIDKSGEYWLLYHQKDAVSEGFYRSVCLDKLLIDEDGVLHCKATRDIEEIKPVTH